MLSCTASSVCGPKHPEMVATISFTVTGRSVLEGRGSVGLDEAVEASDGAALASDPLRRRKATSF